jgi:hypothetical protein
MQGNSRNSRDEDLLATIDHVIEQIDDLRRERSDGGMRTARLQLGAVHARARMTRHGTRKHIQRSGD